MKIIPQNKKTAKLYIGSAFYPEHWPEERWKEDIHLMQSARFNVARLGDFAWSSLEPEDERFEFGWLERAITALSEVGIETVLSTPTAGPPAWLVKRYPQILPIDETGKQVQFGNRCHYCVNSPDFHYAAQSLVSHMAERFGPNPSVIGWQIDNEFNRYCYCPHCRQLFQDYLKERFGSLEELNHHWTTAYWSQTYDAWDEIPIPIDPHNPGLMLEFRHFVTRSYKRFQRLQIDELRPHLHPQTWVTHNYMDWHDGYDHYAMSQDLDIASWDWYVGMGHHDYQSSGAQHDLVRGYKRQNFWLMETQPGSVNWKPVNTMLNKGEARCMAWQAVGHGADAVLYWQWRSALNGQEQYHGSLLDQSGRPRPFYEEARHLAQDISIVSELFAGTKVKADTAILNCYDSRWSIQWQPHHKDFSYIDHLMNYYRPLAAENITVDIISADASLDGYKLVIAPALLVLDDKRITSIKAFVENGGQLVLTIRSGMKDEYNALLPMRQPGALAELCGVQVEEYYALLTPVPVKGDGWSGSSHTWAERLKILDGEGVQVLATYGASNGWLDGQPAITRYGFGRGKTTFIGAYLDEASQKFLLKQLTAEAGIKPVMVTPSGVEACRRLTNDGREIIILINHDPSGHAVDLPWPAYEHIQQQFAAKELLLDPYGVAVLTSEG